MWLEDVVREIKGDETTVIDLTGNDDEGEVSLFPSVNQPRQRPTALPVPDRSDG